MNAEDDFLRRILPRLPEDTGLILGPGDDCAAVRAPKKRDLLLLKTDCVVEDVHFLRSHDPVRVGWKALCRPLSDIAAMGGTPSHALITILSPPDVSADYWKAFYRGLGRAAKRFGVAIVGGEISRQPSGIAVSVALTGTVPRRHLTTRSGGRPGDHLFVTGHLGGSLAGHHLDFIPRLAEGRWLAKNIHPRAMMDLSDGLGSDLPRLARASGCGFHVDFSTLPLRRGCGVVQAISDGEDYELLFAVSPRSLASLPAKWKEAFPRTRLTRIGTLDATSRPPDGWSGGWDHFAVVGNRAAGQPPEKSRGFPGSAK